ncbi:MAG: helix-turn-helix domain-containing protein [Ruminococcus sp.]
MINGKLKKEEIFMDIGMATQKRITELCKLNNITINKLSIMCGITQSTLNNIISGRNKSTTVSTIKKICDGLNITILDFFDSPLFENLEQEVK